MTRICMAQSCNIFLLGTSGSMPFLSDCKVKDFCFESAKYVECKCFYVLFDVINSQKRKSL